MFLLFCLVGWLVGWLIDWLVGWLVGWLGFTSHRHSIGHMATFQFRRWKKTLGAFSSFISGTNKLRTPAKKQRYVS
jgi:hypothetical protein